MKKGKAILLMFLSIPLYADKVQGDSGLIVNYDSNYFLQQTPIDKLTVEGMTELVNLYPGTQVKRMFLNVNAQTTTYKSNVWSSAWDDDDIEVLKKEDRWPYKAKLLHEKGIDPYQIWIKGFREKGISPWVSMRMNDVHYNSDISHWIHSKFWREHPEYWRVQGEPQKGYYDRAFDYEHNEVRDYHMALIKELLERYRTSSLADRLETLEARL